MNFEYQKNNWKTFFWTCFWVALGLIFISGIVWLFCASAETDGNLKVVGCGNEHHWLYHFRWFKYFGLLSIYAIIVVIKNYREHLKKFRWENYKTVKMSYKHFKDTHLINTNRWHVNKDNGQLRYDLQPTHTWSNEWVQVLFSFPDWCKFNIYYWMRQHAKKIQKREDEEKERNELLARVIKEMQKDVNKAFEELAVPDKTDPEPEPEPEPDPNLEHDTFLPYREVVPGSIYYDYAENVYRYQIQPGATATFYPYNCESYSQIQNTIQELANLKVKVSTIDDLMNSANHSAQYAVGGGGGGSTDIGGAGSIFTKVVQLDSQYSLYYTSDENKIYLYDTHTGTYNQIY